MMIVIGGPTGSGKSTLAMRLAQCLNGVIINGDAFQVYRDFNIGTMKPSIADRLLVKHYLFDYVNPEKDYNVKKYQEDFRKTVDKLQKEQKTIIVVGGTGLYQKAALYDYVFEDEKEGVDLSDLMTLNDAELHEVLKGVDPTEAAKLHPSNRKRVLRAIAIYRRHGKSKTDVLAQQEHKLLYEPLFIGLNLDREKLMKRLDERVDLMIEMGLVEEVKHLLEKYKKTSHAFQAIGYREIVDYIDGITSLEDAIKYIKKNTKAYAKRQVTFFKHQLPINWYEDQETAYQDILLKLGKVHE